jgi:fumarylacetoacetate (FAA) hydrolase family protein
MSLELPADWREASLLGRLLTADGPTPVVLHAGRVIDVSDTAPTVSEFAKAYSNRSVIGGRDLGDLHSLLLAPEWERKGTAANQLLSPLDLQCVKAAGVTFAISAMERVIEERARGSAEKAQAVRNSLAERVGVDIASVKPGSSEAARLKEALIADGLWSQYLEVAIGPDAEVFTKAPVLSSVGWGSYVGIRSDSVWNNPEPEIVIVGDDTGRPIGATLGNDVNLRDIEGRSALLLGKAKDNNASCAVGPFIRLFDETFTMDDVRNAVVTLQVRGEDGFELRGESTMRLISRDPLELIGQTIGKHHQYPDGFALFLGTLFAPIADRDAPGRGFTHKVGDVVRVASVKLGTLENKVTTCDAAPPWNFGVMDLMKNLAARGLLKTPATNAERVRVC